MVFERDIPSSSPRDVLIQYLRRALIEVLQQVRNGIESDCISFRLEHLIDVLLRSASIYQDGGQVLALLREALAIIDERHEDESTARTLPYSSVRGTPRVEIQADTLKFFLEFGLKAGEIGTMFSVRIRTIRRRTADFNLREKVPRYTPI